MKAFNRIRDHILFIYFTKKKKKHIIWTFQNHKTVELLKLLFLATGAINTDIIKTNKYLLKMR